MRQSKADMSSWPTKKNEKMKKIVTYRTTTSLNSAVFSPCLQAAGYRMVPSALYFVPSMGHVLQEKK